MTPGLFMEGARRRSSSCALGSYPVTLMPAVHTASTRSVLKQPYLNNIEATENW
jgi:hypothetical protein